MTKERTPLRQRVAGARDRAMVVRQRAERTLLWRVWDRMLEIEFVDRSVALAGKAFVSFFPAGDRRGVVRTTARSHVDLLDP